MIYQISTEADLVYLSACGRNTVGIKETEPLNLPHSLLTAGAKTVIFSLWQSDDLASAILAKRFYRNLSAGFSYSEALRKAKLFIKQEINPHPAYWSGFHLYGNRGVRDKVQL
jgi:CHAT domain-containing protein